MAFKENKDSISIDKGAASEKIVSEAITDLTLEIANLSEEQQETSDYANNVYNELFNYQVSTNSALTRKADLLVGSNTVPGSQINSVVGTLTKNAGLSIGADSFNASFNSYSAYGSEWSVPNTTPSTSSPWHSGIYGSQKFVLISGLSNLSTSSAYSTNGITWTLTTMPSARWQSVTYGADKFVAVSGTVNFPSGVVANSTDGITWTAHTHRAFAWRDVAYGDNKFVAVGYSTIESSYSTDGATWTQGSMPSSQYWKSVLYGADKFVAVAGGANITSSAAAYSTDGITWTSATMPSSRRWVSLAYGNGTFVAVSGGGLSSNVSAYSTNGISWTQGSLPSSVLWQSVAFVNNVFIAVAGRSSNVAYSTNGITWTGATTTQSNFTLSREIIPGVISGPVSVRVASEDYVNAAIAAAIAAL
jgi:hypothetical protein